MYSHNATHITRVHSTHETNHLIDRSLFCRWRNYFNVLAAHLFQYYCAVMSSHPGAYHKI
jgi:hypothetical protein